KSSKGSVSFLNGTYNVSVSKEGYTPKRKELILDADRNYTFIIIPVDTLPEESASETGETELNDSRDQVFLAPLEKAVYSSSYIPLVFEFQGSAKRCQVLKKDASTSGYEIIHTLLDVKQTNEVILTDLPEGRYDLRVRCIISSDEAVVSTTQRVTTIDIDDNVKAVQSLLDSSQEVIEKINSFPSSFKQAFIEDIVSLEEVVVRSKKLLAQAKSAEDVEETSRLMKLLLENSSKSIIEQVTVESSEDSITYASLDDASLVTEYLDLSKDPSRLWEEQEQFAIKINYNFVTLSYLSGLSKKETFVSAQVIPVQGVDFDADYDLYFIMPSFLLSRLAESNDVVSKRYEEASLVRILENSSALIFDGWLDDTTLVRAVVLADDVSLGNKVTGRAVSLSSLPEWKIPLFSFIIILVLAGLFFNPYYSIIDLLQQNPMASFTSQVHECIDAMLSKEYARTVEMIPKVLDTHQKLSSEQKSQVTGIMKKIEELFYESSYHLAFQKIRLKPSHLWSFEELEVAIKDFYASYNMLSPQKQKENLPHFNQMLFKAQELLSQVKR
ncbi:MAG: hypothetical protein KC535_05400, partial [Nanoarchaeota archaeon]|nr:hypothetical protein [Nanoarchaeota archaeon]